MLLKNQVPIYLGPYKSRAVKIAPSPTAGLTSKYQCCVKRNIIPNREQTCR